MALIPQFLMLQVEMLKRIQSVDTGQRLAATSPDCSDELFTGHASNKVFK